MTDPAVPSLPAEPVPEWRRKALAVASCSVSGICLCLAVFLSIPAASADALLHEGRAVETATMLLFFVAALVAGVQGLRSRRVDWYVVALLLAAFAFRELDFQARFTSMGVLKSRFYTSSGVPLREKVIAGAVLILLTAAASWVTGRHARATWRALQQGYGPAFAALICFALLRHGFLWPQRDQEGG
jgi:hypothetical protein